MSSLVEYHRFSRGETCTEEGCRARKFYIEDGKKFCKRGHEQAGFTQTQQDEDDWNAQGKKSRRKREKKEHVENVLSGSDARALYLQCYQLILWKQVYWLITVKSLPTELETVVRDLWSLRLGVLRKERGGTSGYGSTTATTMFSSMSEGEATETDGSGFKSSSSKRSKRSIIAEEKLPKLAETLAFCHLAIFMMRLPTSLGELFQWASQDDFIYNRAIKEVPKDMRSKLPSHFHSALEIHTPLQSSHLHRIVLELIHLYHEQFELILPPLNTPLFLYKHMKDLGLPIEIYPAVFRLASMLDINFTFPILKPKRTRSILLHPEIQLICLVVVATKLSHPFDNVNRVPANDEDPTTVKIDWEKWRATMAEKTCAGFKKGEQIHVTDDQALEMSPEKMDDYLTWYERLWIDDRESKMPQGLLELFPLPEPPQSPERADGSDLEDHSDRLMKIQANLVVQESKSADDLDTDDRRPGELYRRYRTINELPEHAKAFYEKAAENAGISLKTLVRGVFETEIHIEHWLLADRKKRYVEERDKIVETTPENH